MRNPVILILSLVCILLLVSAGCSAQKKPPAQPTRVTQGAPVQEGEKNRSFSATVNGTRDGTFSLSLEEAGAYGIGAAAMPGSRSTHCGFTVYLRQASSGIGYEGNGKGMIFNQLVDTKGYNSTKSITIKETNGRYSLAVNTSCAYSIRVQKA